ncbi:hypothetical protein ACXET9_03590 [Brachybacterium sp. DNPG3]
MTLTSRSRGRLALRSSARPALLLAALALSLSACSGGADDGSAASDAGGDAASTSAAGTSDAADSAPSDWPATADGADAASDEAEAGDAVGTTLTITHGEESIEFAPSVAQCETSGGEVTLVLLSMDEGGLPLIKAVPGEFALVQLDDSGEPEKNDSSTEGITAEDGVVTFDDAVIGEAVVDGSIRCSSGDED